MSMKALLRKYVSGQISVDRLILFVFGVVFVCVLLVLGVLHPEPTVSTWFIFKVVLALVAGGVGAMIPGSLRVGFKWARAAGAAAFFLVVLVLPVESTVAKKPDAPSMDIALASADELFRLLDRNELYERMTPDFRKRYTKAAWDLSYKNMVEPLGRAKTRKFVGANHARLLWQFPQGDYLQLTYQSTFENHPGPVMESLVFFSDDGKTWQPAGYQVAPLPVGITAPTTGPNDKP